MEYIDTNIFIRYLTKDDPQFSAVAYEIMRQLEEGSRTATTCEGVIVEVVQVLSSKRLYHVPRAAISFHLANVISFKGLRLSNKQVYIEALALYAADAALDFVDALEVIYMRHAGISAMISFDTDFDRIADITRKSS